MIFKKFKLKHLGLLLLGYILGSIVLKFGTDKITRLWCGNNPYVSPSEIKLESAGFEVEKAKLDSLNRIIIIQSGKIDSLKNNVRVIRETVKIEVEKIRSFSTDYNVELLRENLTELGGVTIESDSLPVMVSSDSTVLISPGNLKDINTAFELLSAEKQVNHELTEIISSDSIKIKGLSEKLVLKDSIIVRTERVYNRNLETLKGEIEKEKIKKRHRGIFGIGTGVVIGVLGTLLLR